MCFRVSNTTQIEFIIIGIDGVGDIGLGQHVEFLCGDSDIVVGAGKRHSDFVCAFIARTNCHCKTSNRQEIFVFHVFFYYCLFIFTIGDRIGADHVVEITDRISVVIV